MAAGLLSLLAGGCLTVEVSERTVFFPPKREAKTAIAEELRLPGEETLAGAVRHGFLGEGEARIAYTLVAAPGENRPLVVHCGGNSADRFGSGLTYANKVLPFGDVLMFDYPGYGDSGGKPSASAFEAAIVQVRAFAVAEAGARPLVFWGHSLGGFICGELAAQAPGADALVLETTARNAREVTAAITPWWAKPLARPEIAPSLAGYDNVSGLRGFNGLVLVIGASKDKTLPVRLSRSLARGLKQSDHRVTYLELKGAGHTTAPKHANFTPEVRAFWDTISNPDRS